ncbi:MAG: BTAD domain-containing putative transcriptional regulator [Vicinamibacterales bacterium]
MAGPALTVELLGGFRVFTDGRSEVRPPSLRQQELIALLILHARNAPIPRQRIAGSVWAESSDSQALTNLRRELHHLRDGWPALDALIEAGSRTLAWRGSTRTEVDLLAFEAAARNGANGDHVALREAARLYQGDLLPDCTAEWIEVDRERCRQTARSVLARLVGVLEQDRAYGDAIEVAQQLLRLDPLDEPAWCALMRCHARRGERAAALHLYQQCAALLKKELGVQPSAATRMTYREILDLDAAVPIAPAPPRTSVYPLVGRSAEWHAALSAWRAAEGGRPGLLVIRGEAGIGKTRLAEELVDWCRLQGITAVTARSYGGEGSLAYAPIASWLKSDALRAPLAKLDASKLTDVARLHPGAISARPELPAPDGQLESWQRLRFFESLAQAFRVAAPIAMVLDDLQWADADTIEWLQYFLRAAAGTRCLVVATVRAEEEQDNPPLLRLLRQLERDALLTAVVLGPLDQEATAQLAGAVAEHALDDQTLARTYRDTEGHPLFIVERGRMELAQEPGASVDNALSRVQSVVAARLALLSTEARSTAEVAAALGRDFRFDMLAQVSDLEEDALVRAVDELWQRHIVRVQADERWDFSHDRIREVAYSFIGPARARLIHRRIAQAMELLFANRLDEVSASIAGHLDRGGQAARAVPFLERAAAVATRVSANEEAIRCLTQALALLETLPPGRDRDEQELGLRSNLSVVLNSTRGYAAPDIEGNLERVFLLSGSSDGGEVPVRWLWVAFTHRFMLGDLKGAREAAERALERSADDPSCRCEAHHAMGGLLMSVGELEPSRAHFEASLSAYDERHPQRSALGSDLGVFAHAWYSHALWLLGEEDAALAHADHGVALAHRQDHPYSQTVALAYAGMLHHMRRDPERVLECAQAAVALCERNGFAYYGDWCHILIGWVRGRERPAEGIEVIESALTRLDEIRAQARRAFYLSLLADTYLRAGDRARAASIVNEAIAIALDRGDVWWLPALYLQKSELLPLATRDEVRRRGLELAVAQSSVGLQRRILETSSTQPS